MVRPASASESLTGSGEKPAGLPVVLRGGPNPHSWRLCQASRLSVTLVGGMQAAHANSLRPDWGNASRLLISESLPVREVLISLIWASFFFSFCRNFSRVEIRPLSLPPLPREEPGLWTTGHQTRPWRWATDPRAVWASKFPEVTLSTTFYSYLILIIDLIPAESWGRDPPLTCKETSGEASSVLTFSGTFKLALTKNVCKHTERSCRWSRCDMPPTAETLLCWPVA